MIQYANFAIDLLKFKAGMNLGHHQHFLLACFPKSGSTYLSAILSELNNFNKVSLTFGYDRREQELDICSLILANRKSYIAQHHVRYSEPLSILIKRFNIKPIVLVRDIFDIIASVRDHLRNESVVAPMAYIPEDFINKDDDELEFFIASMVVPWYLNFFLSWGECEQKITVNYSELSTDPMKVIQEIFKFNDISISPEAISNAIDAAGKRNIRKNKAIAGRGSAICKTARDKVFELSSFYRGYDFTEIGIG